MITWRNLYSEVVLLSWEVCWLDRSYAMGEEMTFSA